MTGLDEAPSSFSVSGTIYIYVLRYIVVVAYIPLFRGVGVNGIIIIIDCTIDSITITNRYNF
jgi:hypothetical protein